MDKTNAVRLVESAGLTFVIKEYEYDTDTGDDNKESDTSDWI